MPVDPETEGIQLGANGEEGTGMVMPSGKIGLPIEVGYTGNAETIMFYILPDKCGPPVTLGADWQKCVDVWVHPTRGIYLNKLKKAVPLLTEEECKTWMKQETYYGVKHEVETDRFQTFGAFMTELSESQEEFRSTRSKQTNIHPDRQAQIAESLQTLTFYGMSPTESRQRTFKSVLTYPAETLATLEDFSVNPETVHEGKEDLKNKQADVMPSWVTPSMVFRLTPTRLDSVVGGLVQSFYKVFRLVRRKLLTKLGETY